jgi:hypothetical protein
VLASIELPKSGGLKTNDKFEIDVNNVSFARLSNGQLISINSLVPGGANDRTR